MVTTIKLKSEQSDKSNEKFFRTLYESAKIGCITSIDDVVNIYKGISGVSSEDLTYRYGLSRRLREFLVELLSKNIDKDADNENILKIKNSISEYIKLNEATSPYADLPTAERNALYDLTEYIEKGESDSSKRKLLELAAMIQARNDDMTNIKNTNKWTVPLSIIGLFLTIIFGVIALIK
jgi:hypothetical protein